MNVLKKAIDTLLSFDIWTVESQEKISSSKAQYDDFITKLRDRISTNISKEKGAIGYGNYSLSQLTQLYCGITSEIIAIIKEPYSLRQQE